MRGTSAGERGGDITDLGLRMMCDTLNCILRLNLQSVTSIKVPFPGSWVVVFKIILVVREHTVTYIHTNTFTGKYFTTQGKFSKKKKKELHYTIARDAVTTTTAKIYVQQSTYARGEQRLTVYPYTLPPPSGRPINKKLPGYRVRIIFSDLLSSSSS